MSEDVVISVRNLTKTYNLYDRHGDRVKETFHPFRKKYHRPFNALSDISFDVSKRESLGIIGRNGSGKSTLLQVICGILQPTSGTAGIKGKVSALLELGTGFNPEFTGRQNVYINARILGLTEKETTDRLDDILAFADIGDFIDQQVKTYSSGMMIRLAFSVIAHVDADILVIDEALAVGDVFFVQKCMRWIREFEERGVLIFVTHDLGALTSLCKRAIWLDEGRIVRHGPAKTVAESYLEAFYEDQQGVSASDTETGEELTGGNGERGAGKGKVPQVRYVDQRLKFLNHTQYRNDVRIFRFAPKGDHFGKGGVKVTEVELRDIESNSPLSHVVGGELVRLFVKCKAEKPLTNPIIGFYCRNNHGQELFGDNTYLTYKERAAMFSRGETFYAAFTFQMPVLLAGDYSITIAVAEGTPDDHIMHCWFHDALILKSFNSSVSQGLIGIPMIHIEINRSD